MNLNDIKVGIVILNYNGLKDTLECINSLSVIKGKKEVFVVDNCSKNNEYQLLKEKLQSESDIFVIETGQNLGYAGGNNVGIKEALRRGCEYICVLNNDTIATEDFIEPCIKELRADEKIAFIGPTILNDKTGLVQSAGAYINILTGSNSFNGNGKKVGELDHSISCDYIGGACIICHKAMIEKFGYIPECYFLYYEETEWCYRAKKSGYKIVCLGDTFIRHKGGVSIQKMGGLSEYLMRRNCIAFIRRNSPNHFLAFVTYEYLTCLERMKHVIKHDKEYKFRIRAYSDGWNKRIDLKKYPYILIRDD